MLPNPSAACGYWPNCAVASNKPFTLAWLALLLLLSGCASQLPLPSEQPRLQLPLQLHIQARNASGSHDQLLVIQQEQQALRWTLLTPLGVPVARQLLNDGRWQADGLLPPNAQARELFAALLFALTPDEQLDRLYAGQRWSRQQHARRLEAGGSASWHVRYRQDGSFQLDVGPRLTYGVAPLDNGAQSR